MKKNKYDCVIIGAGIAGIAAAIELAANGKKVVIIEKREKPGGYFSGFQNEYGDKFDYAISYILSCGKDDVVYNFLKSVDLHEVVKFKKLNISDEIYINNKHFLFGTGKENFQNMLIEAFPENEKEIRKLTIWLDEYLNGVLLHGKTAVSFLLKYYRKDYQEFIEKTITNELLKAILSVRIQADPASLMIMAGFMCECYFKGMYYPEGGSNKFVKTLMTQFYSFGGIFFGNEEVIQFEEENEKIVSIKTKSGKKFGADSFIYNGDVLTLYKKLNKTKELYHEIKKRKVGHSSISIYLAVKNYNLTSFKSGRIYITESKDIFSIYKKLEKGEIPSNSLIKIHIPSNHDNTLSNEKHGIIRVETDIFYNDEETSEKDFLQYASEILKYIEKKIFPDLSNHIVYKRIITPIEFKNLFGHTAGSGTGWAHTVQNMMVSKMSQKTPYANFFIAGQWGEYGSGIRQLILSAQKSVQYVNNLNNEKEEKNE